MGEECNRLITEEKIMMKKNITDNIKGAALLLLAATDMTLSSCGNFLDEYSTDERYCETPQDLEDLMIGEAFIPTTGISVYGAYTLSPSSIQGLNYPYLDVLDDDAVEYVEGETTPSETQQAPLHTLGAMYTWAADPRVDALNIKWDDGDWKKTYKCIGAINSIIYQCGEMRGKTQKDAEQVMLNHTEGEARFLRAYYYFVLANIYGTPYRKATASTDLSVPMKTSETIEDKYYTRSTNAEVWGQIAEDLRLASGLLKGYTPESKLRGGYGAVKALQSRVALYMEDYATVISAADELEDMNYDVLDLNGIAATDNDIGRSSSDVIFTMSQTEIPIVFVDDQMVYDYSSYPYRSYYAAANFRASDDLIRLYAPDDLRLADYFRTTVMGGVMQPNKYKSWSVYNDTEGVSNVYLLRLAEVWLNKAEAEAMLGQTEAARTTIERLRARRFKSADASVVPSGEKELVSFIRDERRRELCFEGHRWFDLRRYSVNSKYPLSESFTIQHPTYAYDADNAKVVKTGTYVLNSYQKDQAAWIIPIPDDEIEFNRGSLTNFVRTERNSQ